MCGIIGYIGYKDAARPVYQGLEALRHRGYDSAGAAFIGGGGEMLVVKQPDNKLEVLRDRLVARPRWGLIGIGHTRWATHGEPSERNAHPHLSPSGRIALVHNGMVENFGALKAQVDASCLTSETDTEIIAHLIERELAESPTLAEAVRRALLRVRGAYAIAVISADTPGELIAAANGGPLAIGTTNEQGEWFVASEPVAFAKRVRLAEFLEDGEIAVLAPGLPPSIVKIEGDCAPRASSLKELDLSNSASEKGAYAHFMRKELDEAPEALRNTLRGRLGAGAGGVHIGALTDADIANRLRDADHVVIAACGTSRYAGQIGKLILERFARIRVEACNAAAWRYGAQLVTSKDAFVAVSQSGETKDVIEALRYAKQRGALAFTITNRVGSALARMAGRGMYLHAGPEVAVASTKAFVCQVAAFALLGAKLAFLRRSSPEERIRELLDALNALPEKLRDVLRLENAVRELAAAYENAPCIPIIGRGFNEPVALEGALKLQEVAYHAGAHGFEGSELKHGPIALLEAGTPVIAIVPKDGTREKMLGNISEALARGAHIIALTTGEDEEVLRLGPQGRIRALPLPVTAEELYPALTAPVLQLFAYHLGVLRGHDVDTPRNLAKTVTVE